MTSPRRAAETGLPLIGRPENFFAKAGNQSIWRQVQTHESVRPDHASIVPSVTATASPHRSSRDARRYLLIQRQFEDPDDHLCYIETHDKKYCGHFLLRRVDFTSQKLSIEIERPRDNFVSVTFAMVATEFAEASQVVKIISGEIESP